MSVCVQVLESSVVIAVSAGNLTVTEGQWTVLDAGTLVLADRYFHSAEPVLFSVLTGPSHGRLEAVDRPSLPLTQFTSHQLLGRFKALQLTSPVA